MIGVLSITGLGVKITSLILSGSGGLLWPAILLTAAPPLRAQTMTTLDDDPWCDEDGGWGRRSVYCEVREVTLPE